MKRILGLFVLLGVLLGCGCGRAQDAKSMYLSAHRKGAQITLLLENRSEVAQTIAKRFAYAGRSGGNVIALVLNERGQVFQPCAILDTLTPLTESRELSPKSRIVIWKATVRRLSELHCMLPGTYKVLFAYRKLDGDLILSNTIDVVVKSTTESTQQP